MRLPLASSPLQVWAVEDTSIQITWGSLPTGAVEVRTGDHHHTVEHPGGPGSLNLHNLEPDHRHHIDLKWPQGRAQLIARTLPPPPGRPLSRIATVSDLHLGASYWGASKRMLDRSGHEVPFAVRCARAAVSEAIRWGAELLVIKGDAAHHEHDEHFDLVGDLVDGTGDLPVLLIPGNHDVDGRGRGSIPAKVGARGVPIIRHAASVDLAGLRVIAADTTVPGQGHGSIDRVGDDILELAELSPGPVMVGIHHQFQARRFPTHYPLGVRAPASNRFLDELASIAPTALVTSGHTHRNRARRHGPLKISEVASTRDWPGVWAGYTVHEGGIRQVIRRVAAADAISWHEYSSRALLGLWEHWAVGPLNQRCFVHRWG